MYEARKKTRSSFEESIRGAFCSMTHFDGKLLPDNEGVNFDCLAIVVSGKGIEKLPTIPNCLALALVVQWGIRLLKFSVEMSARLACWFVF